MPIRGFVDSVTSNEVIGWAYAPNLKGGLTVQATVNHEIVGEAVANLHRPDLAAAGLGDGNCGFSIALYREVEPLFLPFLLVRPEGADVEFPRTSNGYAEFFRSVYRHYPAAGRQRSVYGGLWMDRTDALALLRGKLTIGMINPALSPALTQMISTGFAVVPVGGHSSKDSNAMPCLELAAQIVDDTGFLEILQAILEDVPVVIAMSEVTSSEAPLAQASASSNPPSPAECLELVVPRSGKGVAVDVVRESHLLPEFTPDGHSRWIGTTTLHIQPMSDNTLLDRLQLQSGLMALFGPGTVHRVRLNGNDQKALRMTLVPSRVVPVTKVLNARREYISTRGVRFMVPT
jgi:hypothetical protein